MSSDPDVATVLATGSRVTFDGGGRGRGDDPGDGDRPRRPERRAVVRSDGEFLGDRGALTELRTRIDALRSPAGLTRFAWTDAVLTPGVTPVRRVHLLELRAALAEAYTAAGRAATGWTDAAPSAGATPIRAAHLMELRTAVRALE